MKQDTYKKFKTQNSRRFFDSNPAKKLTFRKTRFSGRPRNFAVPALPLRGGHCAAPPRVLAAQQKEEVTKKMAEALMKLAKATATRTVDIILASFISASAIFFCHLFLLLCCAHS